MSLGLPVVQEVVDLAVEGGDLAVSWAAALPSGFGGAQELLALEEPLEAGAAVVWSGRVVSVASGSACSG
jgi:hypothetical protein